MHDRFRIMTASRSQWASRCCCLKDHLLRQCEAQPELTCGRCRRSLFKDLGGGGAVTCTKRERAASGAESAACIRLHDAAAGPVPGRPPCWQPSLAGAIKGTSIWFHCDIGCSALSRGQPNSSQVSDGICYAGLMHNTPTASFEQITT